MKASLDTDIIIHLYKSGKKELLFEFFEELYIHEYLLEKEVKDKSSEVYTELYGDIQDGYIVVIRTSDLIDRGIKTLFEDYMRDYEILFDRGELRAIALAKAMGIMAFVSDDTKDDGPHQLLQKELIQDVIPFAFYELLFLKFLRSELTTQQYYDAFNQITVASMAEHPMRFTTKIKATVRRFSKYGTERDIKWRDDFCKAHDINFNKKMIELRDLLGTL